MPSRAPVGVRDILPEHRVAQVDLPPFRVVEGYMAMTMAWGMKDPKGEVRPYPYYLAAVEEV